MCQIQPSREPAGALLQWFCSAPAPPYWEDGREWHQDAPGEPLYRPLDPEPSHPLDALQERANRAYAHDSAPRWVRREGHLPRW